MHVESTKGKKTRRQTDSKKRSYLCTVPWTMLLTYIAFVVLTSRSDMSLMFDSSRLRTFPIGLREHTDCCRNFTRKIQPSLTLAPWSAPDCTRLQIRSFDAGEITGPRSAPGWWPTENEMKTIVFHLHWRLEFDFYHKQRALKFYNSHIGLDDRKCSIWKIEI